MSQSIVIRGRYAGQSFVASEPLPLVEGPAELIVHPQATPAATVSIFELFGTAPQLRSAEDIDEQVRQERESWDE